MYIVARYYISRFPCDPPTILIHHYSKYQLSSCFFVSSLCSKVLVIASKRTESCQDQCLLGVSQVAGPGYWPLAGHLLTQTLSWTRATWLTYWSNKKYNYHQSLGMNLVFISVRRSHVVQTLEMSSANLPFINVKCNFLKWRCITVQCTVGFVMRIIFYYNIIVLLWESWAAQSGQQLPEIVIFNLETN